MEGAQRLISLLYPRIEHGREVWPAMFLPFRDCPKHPHPMRWDPRVSAAAQIPCPMCDQRRVIYCTGVGPTGAPERFYYERVIVRHEEPGTQGLAPVWIAAARCHRDRAHDPDDDQAEGW